MHPKLKMLLLSWKSGIFKDVRFYTILNFGHFWAPSPLTFTMSRTMVNRFFGQEGTKQYGPCFFLETSLSHGTQQWSTEPSIAHAILNACESWHKFFFFLFFFFRGILLKKIQIIKNNFLLHVTHFQHLAQTWVHQKKTKNDERLFTSNSRKKFSK